MSELATSIELAFSMDLMDARAAAHLLLERAIELHAPHVKEERLHLEGAVGPVEGFNAWSTKHGLSWVAVDRVAFGSGQYSTRVEWTGPDDPSRSSVMYHAEWLVQYHFNRLSIAEVTLWQQGRQGEHEEPFEYRAVQEGIKRFAEKVGLKLREPSAGGRPRIP